MFTVNISRGTISTMESQSKITVYYDGVCNLCSGLMDSVEKSSRGRSFAHADISKGVLPEGVSEEEAMCDVHVVDEHGEMYKGADGVLKILEQYPQWRVVARLGRLPGFRQLAGIAYRIVEKTRYWIFGRKRV